MDELLQLMHDTMGRVARIKSATKILQLGNVTKDEESKLLSIIDTSSDELNKVLDAYYVNQRGINVK